jgi:hypothetical protein
MKNIGNGMRKYGIILGNILLIINMGHGIEY